MVTLHRRPAGPSVPRLTLRWFSHTSDQLLLLLLLSCRMRVLTHARWSCPTRTFTRVQFGERQETCAGIQPCEKLFLHDWDSAFTQSRSFILLHTPPLPPCWFLLTCHYMLISINAIWLHPNMIAMMKTVSLENKTPERLCASVKVDKIKLDFSFWLCCIGLYAWFHTNNCQIPSAFNLTPIWIIGKCIL